MNARGLPSHIFQFQDDPFQERGEGGKGPRAFTLLKQSNPKTIRETPCYPQIVGVLIAIVAREDADYLGRLIALDNFFTLLKRVLLFLKDHKFLIISHLKNKYWYTRRIIRLFLRT